MRRMFEVGDELKRIYGEENVYDFSIGNPNLEPPPSLKKALKELADHPITGMHRYMPNNGYSETRRAIAEYIKEESGLPFTENHVVMTVGAAGGLNVTFKALLDEGDEVIVPSPYFMEFKFYIDNNGGEIRLVETNEDFSLNLEEIEKAIGEKTKAILINSPNNPTGVVYSQESLEKLGALLKRKSRELGRTIYLVSDEAYRRIVYDGVKLPNFFHIPPPHHPGDFPFKGSVPSRGKDWLCCSQSPLRRGRGVDSGYRLCQPHPWFRQCPGLDAEVGRPPPDEIRFMFGITKKRGTSFTTP